MPNGSVTTTFTLSDVSTVPDVAGGSTTYASAADTTSRVTETDSSVAPAIAVAATTATASKAVVNPLRGVTVTDANSAAGADATGTAVDTLTLGQNGPGVLTGAQATATPGTYTLTGTAARIDAQIVNLSFTRAAGAPNSSATTTFGLSDASAVNAMPARPPSRSPTRFRPRPRRSPARASSRRRRTARRCGPSRGRRSPTRTSTPSTR